VTVHLPQRYQVKHRQHVLQQLCHRTITPMYSVTATFTLTDNNNNVQLSQFWASTCSSYSPGPSSPLALFQRPFARWTWVSWFLNSWLPSSFWNRASEISDRSCFTRWKIFLSSHQQSQSTEENSASINVMKTGKSPGKIQQQQQQQQQQLWQCSRLFSWLMASIVACPFDKYEATIRTSHKDIVMVFISTSNEDDD